MKQCEQGQTAFNLLLLLSTVLCIVDSEKRPNIVFVVADDYGFHDIGYHNSEIKTPNLDKLAAQGVKLENYYVQPICSPTRSQLMTGRYQIHTGLQHNIIWPSQPYGMPLQFPTVANFLKDQGYSTHAVGKWHLGFYKKEYTPLNRGFDTFYGYWEGGEDYYTYYNCDTYHNRTIDKYLGITQSHSHKEILSGKHGDEVKWCGYDLRDMDKPVTTMNGTYSTHLYTEKAKDIINQAKVSEKPFFLYLAYQAVHSPMEVPPEYVKPYSFIKDAYRRTYAGMTSCMDEGVGNVTQALKDAGLWDNTILIFSTDNGGEILAGGNNWPLRGYKHTLWEGGVRGIGFVTGPLVKQPGKVNEGLMHVSDWFPTIADMVGAQINSSLQLDGKSQWPMINFGKESPRGEILHNIDILEPLVGKKLYEDTFDTRVRAAIRIGNYKLLTGNPGDGKWYPPPHLEKHNVQHSNVTAASDKNVWLFNVSEDPSEVIDLSNILVGQVRSMLERLQYYNSTAVPPQYPDSDPNCDPKLHGGFWGQWLD
ncbi:arylsulfatase B-like [Physella acuta]|uniref:arylsulfatase B-like n=1 Tax=Physella acuta TaxID=109671 RepID=UPI0027DAEB70|nr:arylsulfatase B-like [Physella acuta]